MGWVFDDSGAMNWVDDANSWHQPTTGFSSNTTGTGPLNQDPGSTGFGNPITTNYNSNLFADDSTAQQLAQQLGGTVVSAPLREAGGGTPGSPFNMPNANYIVMPNGAVENAGTIASWSNSMGGVNSSQFRTALSQEVNGDANAATGTRGTGADYWYDQYTPASTIPPMPQPAAPPVAPAAPAAAAPAPASSGTSISKGTPGRAIPRSASDPSGDGTATDPTGAASGAYASGATNVGNRVTTPGTNISRNGGSGLYRNPGGDTSSPWSVSPVPTQPDSSGPTESANPGETVGMGGGPTTYRNPGSGTPSTGTRGGSTYGGGPLPPTPGTSSGGTNGGYGIPSYPNGNGSPSSAFPTWSTGDGTNNSYVGGDPGYMASALQNRALDYGNTFENAFGNAYTGAQGQSQAYQGQADQSYKDLSQTPGYTGQETSDILQNDMLTGGMTSAGDYNSNFLTEPEQTAIMGDAGSVKRAFDPNSITSTASQGNDWTKAQYQNSYNAAEGALNSGTASTMGALSDYGTRLRATVDPSKLGISDAQVSQLKDQAGRQVGLNYAAQQDQIQRQAEASGNVNPLALAAARERLTRSSAIDNADAVTNADIAATGAQRQANANIAGMQQQNESELGNAALNTNLSLTGLRTGTESAYGTLGANVGATANQQQIGATQAAGNTAIQQAQYADTNNAARAAAIATNRQTTAQNNQAQRYQQGYNTSNALSSRYQGVAQQRIQGQQAVRNYLQGQSQFQGTQANTAGTSRVSGAQTALNGQAQGANAAMGTEIGRRSTRPVTIGTNGISIGV